MGFAVHARKIDGETKYRIWTMERDSYVTDPMTEEEAFWWLIESGVSRLLGDLVENTKRNLASAKDDANVGKWKKELQPKWWEHEKSDPNDWFAKLLQERSRSVNRIIKKLLSEGFFDDEDETEST